jgi:hypothetical protein
LRDNQNGAGPLWQHQVKLVWEGLIEMKGTRMTRFLLVARGTEKLKRRKNKNEELGRVPRGPAVFIDLDCGVRYGMIGEPASPDMVSADAPDEPQPEIPAEAIRHLTQALGPSFLVFYKKVQDELKLSKDQAGKLKKQLWDTVPDAMQFFQKLDKRKPQEREKELGSYRRKAQEKLAKFLKATLKDDQLERLRQLEFQQQGLFALLGRPDLVKTLKITQEQQKQFMAVVHQMQQKIAPLIEEAQSGKGKPDEIGPKAMKIRKEHERKLEAILSAAQKKQWKEMLGKALALDD